MDPTIDNLLNPRFRFPYCSDESVTEANALIDEIVVNCYLYDETGSFKIEDLFNCNIPAGAMELGTAYSVLINGYHVDYPTYSLYKYSHIDTLSPDLEVAAIWGGNRLFST
jgi:hypothetical protein